MKTKTLERLVGASMNRGPQNRPQDIVILVIGFSKGPVPPFREDLYVFHILGDLGFPSYMP